jgi:hypothetical protein
MSYTVTTTAGSTLATIADGTVNSSATSLTLIGKNYTGYGIFLNENYVKLLENFSNGSSPSAPVTGQLWYDTKNQSLKIYNGTSWKPVSGSNSTASTPANPQIGDVWWDLNVGQLKVYSGPTNGWVVVGPVKTSSTSGTTGPAVESIVDTNGTAHDVIKFYVGSTVIAIISKDAVFTPGSSYTISGFSKITPGLNLISSGAGGITGARYTGDSNVALTLNGFTQSNFLRSDADATSTHTVTVNQLKINNDLTVATSGAATQFTGTTTGNNLDFLVKLPVGGTTKALSLSGTSGNVSFAVPLGITSGGTGATTAAQAVTNLGLGNLALINSDNLSIVGIATIKVANIAYANIQGGIISGIQSLAVAYGGTGGADPISARNNLGAAGSGINNDITQITGLTTALTIVQGGTGAVTSTAARNNLGLGDIGLQNANSLSMITGVSTVVGAPIAPTANVNTSNTQVATTSFVRSAIIQFGNPNLATQTWANVQASRNHSTVYTNSGTLPITVYVHVAFSASAYGSNLSGYVGITNPPTTEVAFSRDNGSANATSIEVAVSFVVPVGQYYQIIPRNSSGVAVTGTNCIIKSWNELK